MVTAVTPTKAFGLQYSKETGNVTCNFFDTQTDGEIAKLRESPDKIKISNEFGRSDYVLRMIKQAEDIISKSRKNSSKISEWNKRLDECFNRIENEFKKGDHNREYILKKQLKDLQKAIAKSKGGTVDKIIGAAMKPVNWVKGFFTSKEPEQDIEITQEAIVKIVEGTDITGLTPEEKLKVDFLTKDYATNFTKALKVLTEFKGKVTSTLNTGISIHARSYTSILKEITKPETKKEEPKEATNDKEAEAKKAAEATADAVKPEGKEGDNVNKSNENYSVFDSSYTRRHPVDKYFYEELKAQDKFNRDFDRMLAVTIEQMNIRFDIISELHVIQNPNSTWKDKTIAHERLDRFQVVVPELAGIRVTYGISIENYSISTEGVWDSIKNFFKAIWNYIKRIGYALVNKSMDVEKKVEKAAEEVKKVADEVQAKPDVDGKALDDANQATDTPEKIEKAIQEGEAAADDMKTAEPPHPDVTLGKDGDTEEKPATDTSTSEPTTTTNDQPKTEEEAVQQANKKHNIDLTKDDYIRLAADLIKSKQGNALIAKFKKLMIHTRPYEVYLSAKYNDFVFGKDLCTIDFESGKVSNTVDMLIDTIFINLQFILSTGMGDGVSKYNMKPMTDDDYVSAIAAQFKKIESSYSKTHKLVRDDINKHGDNYNKPANIEDIHRISILGLVKNGTNVLTGNPIGIDDKLSLDLKLKIVNFSIKEEAFKSIRIGLPYLGWFTGVKDPKSALRAYAHEYFEDAKKIKGNVAKIVKHCMDSSDGKVKYLEQLLDKISSDHSDSAEAKTFINGIRNSVQNIITITGTIAKNAELEAEARYIGHARLMSNLASHMPSHEACARWHKKRKQGK